MVWLYQVLEVVWVTILSILIQHQATIHPENLGLNNPSLERPVIERTATFVKIASPTPVTVPQQGTMSSISNDSNCYQVPISHNTPTGIAGCERWGIGTGSHYGPGNGVAMNFCTWTRRNSVGCGAVTITSLDTGLSVTVPVVDFCDCYTTTPRERIIDMQWSVLHSLGLNTSQGLYRVKVWRAK